MYRPEDNGHRPKLLANAPRVDRERGPRALRTMGGGAPASSIARRLSRSRSAIAARTRDKGLGLRTTLWGERQSAGWIKGERAERQCLKCGEPFASAHIGNRICRTCKDDEDWSSGPDLSQRRIRRQRHDEFDR